MAFVFVNGQTNKKKNSKPSSSSSNDNALFYVIENDGVKSGIIGLSLQSSTGTTKVYSMKSYVDIFKDSLNRCKPAENVLLKKYSTPLVNYLNSAFSFGETPSDVYVENSTFPFCFISKNGGLCFVEGGIFNKYSLNTLKLNADERASHIVKSVIMPSLANFKPLLEIKEIKYFVLDVGYLAKDFSEEYSGDGELTSIVISRELLIKYVNAEITDSDVFKSALFYNINKNMGIDVRKISIN